MNETPEQSVESLAIQDSMATAFETLVIAITEMEQVASAALLKMDRALNEVDKSRKRHEAKVKRANKKTGVVVKLPTKPTATILQFRRPVNVD